MNDQQELLLDLLERWRELAGQGRQVSPEELCAHCPWLIKELEEQIRFQGRLEQIGAVDAVPPEVARAEEPWPVIPKYKILELLGKGGMGAVYKARDLKLGRFVALKVIKDGVVDSTLLDRFQVEAWATAGMHHPHIVQVYEVGSWQSSRGAELPYLSLEYVAGETLEKRLGASLAKPTDAARLLLLLARAVQKAHEKSIIHRDLKPGNVLLAPPADEPALNCVWGYPKLTDFGLARHVESGSGLTQSGAVLGTPQYASPEQAAGKQEAVGPAADVYGLGGILYWLLTGRHPFEAADTFEILERVRSAAPEGPRKLRSEVPEALESLCLRCLEKEPSQRPSLVTLIEELNQFLNREPTTIPPPKASGTFRAFVSSTFLDLEKHRKCVIDALQKAGIFVDPMENWTADSEEPKKLSRNRVEGCDLCVLLVALRRGIVPQGESLSITQMEYAAARELNLSILVYLFDDSGDYLWPRRFDELHCDPGIGTWRQELKERHVCTLFDHHPEPLGKQVLAGVSRWLQEKAQEAIGPRPVTPAALNFTAFFEEKRRHFVGRQWLFDEIEAWTASGVEHALLVKGDPGAGKSAIVAELVHRNPGGRVLAYHCCQANVSDTLLPGRFVRNLVALLVARVAGFSTRLAAPGVAEALAEADSDPVLAFRRAVLDPLTPADQEVPGVRYLVIDALDEALVYKGAMTIVDVLVKEVERLPAGVRIVATTRKEQAVLSRLAGLRALELDAQSTHNRKDIEDYITLRLEAPALAERLGRSGRGTVEVQRTLASKSAGNFLYVQQALQGIERDQYRFDQLENLPPGLGGLYLGFFERHFPTDPSFEDVRRVLEVVVAAREPLTEEQIARATRLDTREVVPAVLARLGSYLPNRAGRFALYHQSLTDWLKEDKSRQIYHVKVENGHSRLAEYCEREIGSGDPDRLARESPYAIRYRGAHLVEEGAAVERFRPLVTRQWYVTWVALDGTGAGYLADVERVWRKAELSVSESLRRGEPANDLDLEIQCALCRASVQELMRNVPEGVMRELVKRRIWSPVQGLAHAQQIVQLRQRVDSLLFLAEHCSQEQKLSVLREALELLPQVPASQERDSRFRELAEWFARNEYPQEARASALQIGDPNVRDRTLIAVGWSQEVADVRRRHQLAAELGRVEEALAAALQIGPGEGRDEVLVQFSMSLSASGRHEEALAVARGVTDPAIQADLLVEFGRTEESLVPARAIADPERRARLLARLGFAREGLAAALDVSNVQRRAELLMELGRSHSELKGTEQQLAAIRDLPDPVQRANLMLELGQKDEAVEAARQVPDPVQRANLMLELGPKDEALVAAREAADPVRRALLLDELWRAEEALTAIRHAIQARRPDLEPELDQAEAALRRPGVEDVFRRHLELHQAAAALATARQRADPKQWVDLLVKVGQPIEALAVVRAVTDPVQRANLLLELGQKDEALVAAREAVNPGRRAVLLEELRHAEEAAAHRYRIGLHSHDLELLLHLEEAALKRVRQRANPKQWVDLLVKLDHPKEALEVVREVDDPEQRANLMLELGQKEEAVEAAREVTHPKQRIELLVKLGLVEEALAAARLVPDPGQRAELLLEIDRPAEARAALDALLMMPESSSRNDQVAEVVRCFVSNGDPGTVLESLLALPVHQAFDSLRSVSLLAVMGRFAPAHFRQALEEVSRITGTEDRARIMAALVGYLPRQVLPQARETLVASHNAEALEVGLAGLARRAAQLGCIVEALASLDLLPSRRKEQTLVDLLDLTGEPLTPTEAGRLRQDTCRIENPHLAARGLARLVRQLVQQQEVDRAWAIVSEDMPSLCEGGGDSLEGEWANAIIALVPTLPPDRYFAAFMLAQALKGTRERARVVEALAPYLSDQHLSQAVRLLQALEDEVYFTHFVNEAQRGHLPEALPTEANEPGELQAIRRIASSDERLRAFTTLAPHLRDDLLAEGLGVIAGFPGRSERIRALAALAPRLKGLHLEQALAQARAIPLPPQRTRALIALASHLPFPNRCNLIDEADKLPNLVDRVEALGALANLLPARQKLLAQDSALGAFRDMRDPVEQVTALRLLPSAEEVLPMLAAILEAVAALGNGHQRRASLAQLAPWLTRLDAPRLHDAWKKVLPVLALRSRRELLADCKALIPALVHLGGSGPLAGVCQAVEHVREWWP
jgi:serine/threonine protein kinase